MKFDTILVRFSELALKSRPVRRRLENRLISNIRDGMRKEKIEGKTRVIWGRIILQTKKIEKTSNLLKHVFGVVSFSPCVHIDLNRLDGFIEKHARKLVRGKTFSVRVRRTGTHDFTSQDLERKLGAVVVEKTEKKVNLTKPESTIFIEVREQDVFVFIEKILGPGGMPLGSQGKVISFVDGNDGILATWLMMKRGCNTVVCHTVDVDILERWSYGLKLEKIEVRGLREIKKLVGEKMTPVVLPFRIQKNSIDEIDKVKNEFHTLFFPLIAFTDENCKQLYSQINM